MARAQRAAIVGVTLVACGRVGFQAHPDGGSADATADATADGPTATPLLIAMSGNPGSATGTQLAITPVTPGDLLVVAVVTWDGTPVASVTAGTPLTSAGARAVQTNTSSELWYASPASAASTVTVTMAGSASGYDVWAAEFSGIAPGGPLAIGSGCRQYPPDVETATVNATAAGQLVIGTTMLAYPAYAVSVAAPFTALPFEDGNGTAYDVTAGPGSYGPTWSVGSGAGMHAMTCSSTALFAPRE